MEVGTLVLKTYLSEFGIDREMAGMLKRLGHVLHRMCRALHVAGEGVAREQFSATSGTDYRWKSIPRVN